MSDNVRRDNRRALPKYLLTILLFGLLGAVLAACVLCLLEKKKAQI